MIFRNSIKSMIRTPVRTAFFMLLIAGVTAFLYLGLNTLAASVAMLREWDENCTTIVTMNYLDDFGSGDGPVSETMRSDIAAIDFEAIATNENVRLWQPADVSMGIADGFVTNDSGSEYSHYSVLIMTGLRQYSDNSPYYGELVESLYSYREYEPGRAIYIHNDLIENLEFEPDPEAVYVIHAVSKSLSTNVLEVSLAPFYSWTAQQAGIDCQAIPSFLQIESAEALHHDEDNIYQAIARYYDTMNNQLTVRRARELADLEEFNQDYLQLVSGRLFTRQEADAGANVCVISETLANSRELTVGDPLTIRLPDDHSAAASAWGDAMSREETFTIIGIVNYHREYHLTVYTPSGPAPARPVRLMNDLGQATIKNGTAEEFLADIRPLLPESVFINVYDQGYQATADALHVIRGTAMALSLIALAVTLTVLALFAYLFAKRQRGSVEIMRCFGAGKAETRLYLMIGTSLTAFLAIAAGIGVGTRYAQTLIEMAYEFVSELQAVDLRYSDGYLGVAKTFTPVAALSEPLAFAVGAAVLILSLFLCLYFAEKTVSGRLMTLKAHERVRRSPRKSSTALSGALRHAVLFIRRGGAGSFIVPVLCAATLLFLALLQSTLASYDTAREALYANTELHGYCTTSEGKFSDQLYIPNPQAKQLADSESIRQEAYTYSLNYGYLGIPERADGTLGHVDPVPVPMDAFELENLYNAHRAEPNLVFTSAVENAPEFYFSEFHAEFMPGWDAARFASRDWAAPPCLVSSRFMSRHGIQPGDTIRVYVENSRGGPPFAGIDLLVTGSFVRVANQDNIYCPLPLGALDPGRSTLNALDVSGRSPATGHYMRYTRGIETLTQQQLIDVLLDNHYVSSLSFTLRDVHDLAEFKNALEDAGFSGPKMGRSIRVFVMVEDAQFNEALSTLTQRSKYLQILYPVFLVLIGALGLITGFLIINSRREDIALMRGMGTPKRRIVATLFGEQLLLLLFGALPAAVAWVAFEGPAQLASPGIYTFFICFTLSAALVILLQNTRSALALLSEKE
ncbi:MAG: ABC transporter permease [Eubacteriales bacterium]|nr:ABC transporter permease [Eubacteriales bacterium]